MKNLLVMLSFLLPIAFVAFALHIQNYILWGIGTILIAGGILLATKIISSSKN